jgi:hypothetical protein
MTRDLPTISEAKQEAKQLRATLAEQGEAISHAQALERVAQRHGFRDWNAFHAEMHDRPPQGWTVGGRVTGHYLSQPFAATVLAADQFRPGWFRLVLDLDAAVDVVRFDSFSNLRKQIRIEVGPEGIRRSAHQTGYRMWSLIRDYGSSFLGVPQAVACDTP